MNSFSANILNGITKLISVFGDQLNDEYFKERVGAISVKQLVRTAKERHAGSMGDALGFRLSEAGVDDQVELAVILQCIDVLFFEEDADSSGSQHADIVKAIPCLPRHRESMRCQLHPVRACGGDC